MSEDYGVFCSCDYDGYFSFCSPRIINKAKKRHRCSECHGGIMPGERYEYIAGVQDGDFWTSKTCTRCLDLLDWITAHVPCFCRMYGALFEDDRMPEMVYQASHTPGFAFGIKRRIVAVQRGKELAKAQAANGRA